MNLEVILFWTCLIWLPLPFLIIFLTGINDFVWLIMLVVVQLVISIFVGMKEAEKEHTKWIQQQQNHIKIEKEEFRKSCLVYPD